MLLCTPHLFRTAGSSSNIHTHIHTYIHIYILYIDTPTHTAHAYCERGDPSSTQGRMIFPSASRTTLQTSPHTHISTILELLLIFLENSLSLRVPSSKAVIHPLLSFLYLSMHIPLPRPVQP
jgi:hypothetical protein